MGKGGGSIRIHDHLMQRKVFNIINVPNEGKNKIQLEIKINKINKK